MTKLKKGTKLRKNIKLRAKTKIKAHPKSMMRRLKMGKSMIAKQKLIDLTKRFFA